MGTGLPGVGCGLPCQVSLRPRPAPAQIEQDAPSGRQASQASQPPCFCFRIRIRIRSCYSAPDAGRPYVLLSPAVPAPTRAPALLRLFPAISIRITSLKVISRSLQGHHQVSLEAGYGLVCLGTMDWYVEEGMCREICAGGRWPRYVEEAICGGGGMWRRRFLGLSAPRMTDGSCLQRAHETQLLYLVASYVIQETPRAHTGPGSLRSYAVAYAPMSSSLRPHTLVA
jgi:hypothetical protein